MIFFLLKCFFVIVNSRELRAKKEFLIENRHKGCRRSRKVQSKKEIKRKKKKKIYQVSIQIFITKFQQKK